MYRRGQNGLHGEVEDRTIVLVSALNHFLYCPRQCALIHIEQVFTDNILTLRGRVFHSKVDEAGAVTVSGEEVLRGLPLFSDRLGLVGKADLVEFTSGIPYPVEFKHGRKKKYENLDVQLCAQALCLEEMFECEVPKGAIFHISSHRRREVIFSPPLRSLTEATVREVRNLLSNERLPSPLDDSRCKRCSLREPCMPELISEQGQLQVRQVLRGLFNCDGEKPCRS